MAKKKAGVFANEQEREDNILNLRALLAGKSPYKQFKLWIVGDTPLITHAWSEKARSEMLNKQIKAVSPGGKEARNPQEDFVNSLYEMDDGVFGFPTTALKRAIHAVAHQDKGIAKTAILSNVWLDSGMYRVRPALAGAVCDMPLTRIWGGKPEMREDMVRVGAGMKRTATLAYRAQFWPWAMHLTGRVNPTAVPAETLAFLFGDAGIGCGIGDWRNEKFGVFGSFHASRTVEEDQVWEAFTKGGPMPVPPAQIQAEAAE